MMMIIMMTMRFQTSTQFLQEYRRRTPNTTGLSGHQEAPYGYDSVWTVALMLNNSIQRMTDEGFTRSAHHYDRTSSRLLPAPTTSN